MIPQLDVARRLLAVLESDAARARNRVDRGDDGADLAQLVPDAVRQVPGARTLDESARRDVAALDPLLGARLTLFLGHDWALEARLRSEAAAPFELNGQKVPVRTMLTWQGLDPERRETAAKLLGRRRDHLAWLGRRWEKKVAPRPALLTSAGGLVLPGEGMAEALALGVFDPKSLEPEAAVATQDGGLAEALLASLGGDWGAACWTTEVADFRVRLNQPWLGAGDLPTAPWVPARRGQKHAAEGITVAEAGAALLGAGAKSLSPGLAGALVLSAGTLPWVQKVVADPGEDPLATARSFLAWVAQPGDGLAATLAGLPGEEDALYAGAGLMGRVWAPGAAWAFRLREDFDHDWFRNPRASREVLLQMGAPEPSEALVWAWIREHARL